MHKGGDRVKTILDYHIDYEIYSDTPLQVYVAHDSEGKRVILRVAQNSSTTEEFIKLHGFYTSEIVNFKSLPRWERFEFVDDLLVCVFEGFEGATLTGRSLSLDQIEQLLDAVIHLHKKNLVHGHITEHSIWLKDSGGLVLYGAGEETFLNTKPLTEDADSKQVFEVIREFGDPSFFETSELLLTFEDLYHRIGALKNPPDEPDSDSEEERYEETSDVPLAPDPIVPELVEKGPLIEGETERPNLPDVADNPIPVPTQPIRKPFKLSLNAVFLVAAVLVLSLLTYVFVLGKDTATTDIPEAAAIEEEILPVSVPIEQLGPAEALFENWTITDMHTAEFPAGPVALLAMHQEVEGQVDLQIAAVKNYLEDPQLIWSTKLREAGTIQEKYFGGFEVIQSEEMALWGVEVLSASDISVSDVTLYKVTETSVNEEIATYGYKLDATEDTLIVHGIEQEVYGIVDGTLSMTLLPRSEGRVDDFVETTIAPSGDSNVAVQDKEVQLEVGQSLRVVPQAELKEPFDNYEVLIYSNVLNSETPVEDSYEFLIEYGNSIHFTEAGTYEVLIVAYDQEPTAANTISVVVN